MTVDDREAEHVDSCWAGCEDLHACPDCGRLESVCGGDCDERFGSESEPWPPEVVTEYGFEEKGLL